MKASTPTAPLPDHFLDVKGANRLALCVKRWLQLRAARDRAARCVGEEAA
jgi:hypothetical protein